MVPQKHSHSLKNTQMTTSNMLSECLALKLSPGLFLLLNQHQNQREV